MGLVGAACWNADCRRADTAEDSIARHQHGGLLRGRDCYGDTYPASHRRRGLSARGGAVAGGAPERLGLTRGWLNKVRLQGTATVDANAQLSMQRSARGSLHS